MADVVIEALREIVPVTRGEADLGGRMVRCVESGDGSAVILIAGRNGTALSWGPVLAALAGRTRAVAYDRAGLGDSDPDPELPTAERAVADLSTLISLVAGGPCVVAGHSWGGLLALMLAERHPGTSSRRAAITRSISSARSWSPRRSSIWPRAAGQAP